MKIHLDYYIKNLQDYLNHLVKILTHLYYNQVLLTLSYYKEYWVNNQVH